MRRPGYVWLKIKNPDTAKWKAARAVCFEARRVAPSDKGRGACSSARVDSSSLFNNSSTTLYARSDR